MSAAKCKHCPCVNQHAGFVFDRFLERFCRKGRHAREISNHFWPLRVNFFHQWIVLGHWRDRAQRKFRELGGVVELEKFVQLPLVSDCAAHSRADICAARRACAMIRIDHHVIGQLQIKIAQRVKLFFGEFFRAPFAQQIGPARGRDKERIACNHTPRRIGMVGFGEYIRHMLRRMTGSMSRGHYYFAECEPIAVLHRFVFKAIFRAALMARVDFRRFNPGAKLA